MESIVSVVELYDITWSPAVATVDDEEFDELEGDRLAGGVGDLEGRSIEAGQYLLLEGRRARGEGERRAGNPDGVVGLRRGGQSQCGRRDCPGGVAADRCERIGG